MLKILKNKKVILILVTIFIFILMGISAQGEYRLNYINNVLDCVLSPFLKAFTYVGNKYNDTIGFFTNVNALKSENQKITQRLITLENENRELLEYKGRIKELKDALNIKDQFGNFIILGSNIIAKDVGNWFYVFMIDRGQNDGILNNYPVITSKGLVGKIFFVGASTSKVSTIIDDSSSVSARISKTRDLVVVKGDILLKNDGLCKVEYIPLDADVKDGDIVETAGLGENFPKGIIIGKIKQIKNDESGLSKIALLEPAVDFKRIEEVVVLKKK